MLKEIFNKKEEDFNVLLALARLRQNETGDARKSLSLNISERIKTIVEDCTEPIEINPINDPVLSFCDSLMAIHTKDEFAEFKENIFSSYKEYDDFMFFEKIIKNIGFHINDNDLESVCVSVAGVITEIYHALITSGNYTLFY